MVNLRRVSFCKQTREEALSVKTLGRLPVVLFLKDFKTCKLIFSNAPTATLHAIHSISAELSSNTCVKNKLWNL